MCSRFAAEALINVEIPSQVYRVSLARSGQCAETRYDRIHAQDKVYHPRSILIDLGSWREVGRQGGFGLAVGVLHSGRLGMAQRGGQRGLQQLGAMTVYTTCGAGTWGPPVRLGTNPEVVLIHFD